MDVVFGVYLGNSTCSVAANKGNNINVVANAGGDRVTPAVVAVHDDEVVTGLAAKQGLLRFGACSVVGVLRDVSMAEPTNKTHSNTCPPNWDDDGDVSYSVQTDSGPKTVQAVSVLRHLFLQMKDISSRHNAANQCTACLCLPAWVSDRAVAITREAAKEAGYRIVAVVLQPMAACLAYNLLQDRTKSMLVLTLHLGESSSLGGVVEVSGGMAVVRDTVLSTTAPGRTVTNKLVEHLAKEFYAKYRGDCLENKRSRQKLYNQAETVKHVLSTRPSAQVNVDSLWEGVDFSCEVSRARFEGLISSTLNDFLQPTLQMMARLGITPHQIDKVVLSGGTCKICRLQQLVGETFSSAEVLSSISPDEVLAYGAAMEARAVTAKYGNNGNGVTEASDIVQVNGVKGSNGGGAAAAGGKDAKNTSAATPGAAGGACKKKSRPTTERRKHESMRSHLPVLVSALAVPVWCKITSPSVSSSVCALPRLSPPLLRHAFSVPLPSITANTAVMTLTLYEATEAVDGEEAVLPDAAVLAEIKVPVSNQSKELSMSCQLKPDGSLQGSVYEPTSKKSRKFVVSAEEEDDSS